MRLRGNRKVAASQVPVVSRRCPGAARVPAAVTAIDSDSPAVAENPPAAALPPSVMPVVASEPPAPPAIDLANPVPAQPSPTHAQGDSTVDDEISPTPAATVEPSPIEDNAAELCRRSEWLRHRSSWRQEPFFLVNGSNPLNLEFVTNNREHGVAIAGWHEAYRDLELFKNAAKIWVVLSPDDDNAVFCWALSSTTSGFGSGAYVTVGSILDIAKWKVDSRVGRWVGSNGVKTAFETFEHVFKFQPMPQPNHVELIRQLLEKPEAAKPAQLPQSIGGVEPWMSGGSGYAPPSDWKPKIPSGGWNPNGNDGTKACM